jgi:hypothetical protein
MPDGCAMRGIQTRAVGAALLAGLMLAMVGCEGALTGHWRVVEVVPSKEVFSIDDATFHRDGTFTATTTVEGKTTHETGKFSFNGIKLTLQPQAGGRRTYSAMLKMGRLEVVDGKRKVVLKKG